MMPLTSHEMLEPGEMQSAAVKLIVCPSGALADGGDMEFGPEQLTVTAALADFEWSATLVAATVTVAGDGTDEGAVYSAAAAPLATMVPTDVFPPPTPFTLHVIATFGLPDA